MEYIAYVGKPKYGCHSRQKDELIAGATAASRRWKTLVGAKTCKHGHYALELLFLMISGERSSHYSESVLNHPESEPMIIGRNFLVGKTEYW